MNAKMSVFAMCVEAIKYFYYIICMTVPLRTPKIFNQVSTIWKLEHVCRGVLMWVTSRVVGIQTFISF